MLRVGELMTTTQLPFDLETISACWALVHLFRAFPTAPALFNSGFRHLDVNRSLYGPIHLSQCVSAAHALTMIQTQARWEGQR